MVCSHCHCPGHNYVTCPQLTAEQIKAIKDKKEEEAQERARRRRERQERVEAQKKKELENKKVNYEIVNTMEHEIAVYSSNDDINFYHFLYVSQNSTSNFTCMKNIHRITAIPFVEVVEIDSEGQPTVNAKKVLCLEDPSTELPYTTVFDMKMKEFDGSTLVFDKKYDPPKTEEEKWKEYGLKSHYLLKQIEMMTGGTDDKGEVSKKEFENIAPFLDMVKDIKIPETCTELDREKAGVPSKLTNIT